MLANVCSKISEVKNVRDRQNTEEVKRLKKELEIFIAPSRTLLEPLKSLNDEQMRAVVTLSYLMEGVLRTVPEIDVTEIFGRDLTSISEMMNDLMATVKESRFACMDATISYLTSEKDCQPNNPQSKACTDADRSFGSLTACEMNYIFKMKNKINGVWNGKTQKPIWPTTNENPTTNKPILMKTA
jgi:hypothetical protein